jgi:hypothetical protein
MNQSDKYFIPINNICKGCVSRVTNVGTEVGCEQCDENWDLPDLIIENPNANANANANADSSDSDSECEGCKLLDAGLGGENQQGHSCIGY